MTTTTGFSPGCEYRLQHWLEWPHEVHSFVEDYLERFGVFPDALVASRATFARMDMAADIEHVQGTDGQSPAEAEYAALGGLRAPDYQLTFLLNDAVIDKGVLLVREHTGGDGDGEPIVHEDHHQHLAVG